MTNKIKVTPIPCRKCEGKGRITYPEIPANIRDSIIIKRMKCRDCNGYRILYRIEDSEDE